MVIWGYIGIIRVIKGVSGHRGYIGIARVILALYGDNGKEDGNYYNG